jgi:hypothetical protein
MPKKHEVTETETEVGEFAEPTVVVSAADMATLPYVVAIEMQPSRRLVKLADERTMYLLEDGVLHAVTSGNDAVALGLTPDVVDDLAEWPEGDAYQA